MHSRIALLALTFLALFLRRTNAMQQQSTLSLNARPLCHHHNRKPNPPKQSAMDTFLTSVRPRLETEPETHVILVTGNESADLDSIISALTTSFFLSHLSNNKNNIILPFINIPQADLVLRSDVEFVLSSCEVNHDLLFFRDHLPIFESLLKKNRDQLSLFLVDHNKLSSSLSSLKKAKVVGVLDHHADENLHNGTADPRRIEPVGSCASLVADHFFHNAIDADQKGRDRSDCQQKHDKKKASDWLRQVSRLLLGPILIDTMNLDPQYHKAKPLDIAMVKLIFPYTGWKDRDHFFKRILEARRDTSKLSYYDILRKDYKEWTVVQHGSDHEIKVGISSATGLMQKFVKRDTRQVIQRAIRQWAQNRTLDLFLVLMSDSVGDHDEFQRQMAIYPVLESLKSFPEQMEQIEDLKLERTDLIDTHEFVAKGGRAYFQWNSARSRKQIWPYVEKLLTQPADAPMPKF
ncbi:hypothetical protein BCR41DRAFT_316862, partial [Lobosporangium transversale]